MLEDLSKYNNLGTIEYYWELLSLFYSQPDNSWSKDQIDAHFRNRIIDGTDIFDGALPLLIKSGIVEVDVNGICHLSYQFKYRLHSIGHCKGKVLESILNAIKSDYEVYSIFSNEYCTFDMLNNVIQIDKSAFGLRHANIRNVMTNLGFLLPHPNYPERSFMVSKPHKKLFDRYFIEGMRKRQITPEQLRSIQAQQQENGLKGEEFSFNYEVNRTGRGNDIEWIANYDASAGFDIMSFETGTSAKHDRFIEVKTYTGDNPYFYWSRNEMEVASVKGNKYYLYLVSLDSLNQPAYEPIIVNNPYISVLDNDKWKKTVDKYHIIHVAI
jgi:hypothetical protein